MSFFILALGGLAVFAHFFGRRRIQHIMHTATAQGTKQHSLDLYHGRYVACAFLLPALAVFMLWQIISPPIIDWLLARHLAPQSANLSHGALQLFLAKVRSVHDGALPPQYASEAVREAARYLGEIETLSRHMAMWLMSLIAASGFYLAYRQIAPRFRARHRVERVMRYGVIAAALIAIFTTIGIILSLIFEALRFFEQVSLFEFLFGLHWSPQIALRADQAASSGAFGAVPVLAGTLMITLIAMCVAVPIGLMSAIYLAEYAKPRLRDFAKPSLEVLAGIPTVIYGFFAALTVAPALRDFGGALGFSLASESALAAGLVMGVMIIPLISSLCDDVITAVPQSLRDGATALGATRHETIKQVVLPAALPGIASAILLAVSRAIGETMIVVMAAGVAANLTANPFEAVTTVTVQIVVLLVGDQEFDSTKTLAAFALGLLLFILTLALNVIALRLVRKYREQYE